MSEVENPSQSAIAWTELNRPNPADLLWEKMTEEDRADFRRRLEIEHIEKTRIAMAESERAKRESDYLRACPPIYQEDVQLDRITGDPQNAKLIMGWRYNPVGMLITGPTGHGKTRTIWAALKIAMLAGRTVVAMDGIGFANAASQAAYSPDETEKWMRRMCWPDILFIDDLAKRFTKTSGQLLFGLIERRTSNRLPILITTNVTASQLSSLIDDPELAQPLVRRLREFCNPIVL